MYLVTVIIRTYNRCNLLSRALQSVAIQNFNQNNIQVVVVDDASVDNTINIVSEYSTKLNINYIKHNTNIGVAASLQDGILASDSKYVMLLDDDDLYHPDMVVTCINVMENDEELSYVYTDWIEKNLLTDQEVIVSAKSHAKRTGRQAYIDTICGKLGYLPTIGCYRKGRIPKEIPTTLKNAEDHYLGLYSINNGYVKGIHLPLYIVNIHESHTWRNNNLCDLIPWVFLDELIKTNIIDEFILDLIRLEFLFRHAYFQELKNEKTFCDIGRLWYGVFVRVFKYNDIQTLPHFAIYLLKRTLPLNIAKLKG